jgi:hypothetical protein
VQRRRQPTLAQAALSLACANIMQASRVCHCQPAAHRRTPDA